MCAIQSTYKSLVQLDMLIIGQSDKMLTDLRNNTGSRKLSAMSMEILVSGGNFNIANTVFSRSVLDSLVKVRDTARSLLHCSHSSHFS
jgi:hypothetical protein